jgi:Tfp pilus assembly protein PilO
MVKNPLTENELDYKTPLFIGIGAVIGIILIFLIGIRPSWSNISSTQKDLSAKKDYLRQLESKRDALVAYKDKKEELKTRSAKLAAALPSDTDVARLFTQFDRVAVSSGFRWNKVSQEESTTAVAAQATPAKGSLFTKVVYKKEGEVTSYLSVKECVRRTEEALRLVDFDEIEISMKQNKKLLDVTMKVSTFKRGE